MKWAHHFRRASSVTTTSSASYKREAGGRLASGQDSKWAQAAKLEELRTEAHGGVGGWLENRLVSLVSLDFIVEVLGPVRDEPFSLRLL